MKNDLNSLMGKKVFRYLFSNNKIISGNIVATAEVKLRGKKLPYKYARHMPEVFIEFDNGAIAAVNVKFTSEGNMPLFGDLSFSFSEDELKSYMGFI